MQINNQSCYRTLQIASFYDDVNQIIQFHFSTWQLYDMQRLRRYLMMKIAPMIHIGFDVTASQIQGINENQHWSKLCTYHLNNTKI